MTHQAPHCQGCPEYVPPPPETKILSICWPWDHNKLTMSEVVAHAKNLKVNEVCFREPLYYASYRPSFHFPVAQALRDEGIDVSIWPIVSLYDPQKMADSIKKEVNTYKPTRVVLDVEGRWITNYGGNTEKFLLALGDVGRPVGLASYRRATSWPTIRWQTWLKTKVGSKYAIDFAAHQLYPIGWMRPQSWVYQFKLDIDSHEDQHQKAGRPYIPWLPFMPAFAEGLDPYGNIWYPRKEPVDAAVKYMRERLGSRLIGMNWWSLDQDLVSNDMSVDTRFLDLYNYIAVS